MRLLFFCSALLFEGEYQRLLGETRAELARYVSANPDDVVFVENASAGVNAVLRSLALNHTSTSSTSTFTIGLFSCAYPMVTNTADVLTHAGLTKVRRIPVEFPVTSEQDVVDDLDRALKSTEPGSIPTVLSISHIVSTPAVILPVRELTLVAKAHGVKYVLIDGAHAFGHIPINMTDLAAAGVDYYVGNGHKWLYSPKGSAFLWTRPSLQPSTLPTVISSDFALYDYARDFLYTGTRDYTAFVSVTSALAFRDSVGGDAAVQRYMTDLSHWATDLLVKRWGTQAAAPHEMTGAMATVQLPTNNRTVALGLYTWLIETHDVQIVFFGMQRAPSCRSGSAPTHGACARWVNPAHTDVLVTAGAHTHGLQHGPAFVAAEPGDNGNSSSGDDVQTWWVRLSAQIYVEKADFERLADLVDEYMKLSLSDL